MKGILLLMLLLLLAPSAALGGERDALTVIVATDLHYLAPELTDHGPFFEQLISRSDGKVMAYSEELVEAFVSQVIDRQPDALILSGDLTFNGERASHEALARKLARVTEAGIPVLVIPGNHDLNSRSAVRFAGEGYERVDGVTAEDFSALYAAFGYDAAISRDRASLSYIAEPAQGLRVLMVDVNGVSRQGKVEARTLEWVEERLAQAERDGCRVVAVSHQNLIDHSSLISEGFTIVNAGALLARYADAPVLCNLSGHIHMQHMGRSGSGLWDVATSSLAVSPNQYGVLTLTQSGLTYRTEMVDVSACAAAQGLDDPNLLDFAAYSAAFFQSTSYQQALAAVLQDDNPEQLADYFTALNAAYFAGRMDSFAPDAQLAERWQQQPSFLARYIESIEQEPPRNHCALTLPD